MKISPSTQVNYEQLKEAFSSSTDFTSKTMSFTGCEYRLCYLDTMVDSSVFQDHIVRPLSLRPNLEVREVITVRDLKETQDFQEAVDAIVQGQTVLQKEGEALFYLLGTELQKERSINIPSNERSLRGPFEAFIENLDTNINLIRKMTASPDLVVKEFTLGRVSKTRIAVAYIKDIANPEVITLIEQRLKVIDIDYIDAPGFIQEFIQDKRISLFPQVLTTERPDRTRAYLMEGKAVILAEGSPNATLMPVSFWAFLQSPDDYHINWLIGSALRLLRILCFFIAIGLPGLYISLVGFQTYVVPLTVALTLQGALKYIALQPEFEVIFMLLALEILKEATVRLANPIGQAIGVVGGIVVGTAVVQSNLVSNTAVIIASLTGLASFILPSYEMSSATRLLNYPVIVLTSLFGIVGFIFAFLLLLIYLCRMNSMGLPYFYPTLLNSRDTWIRAPIWLLKNRPKEAAPLNRQRLRNFRWRNK